MNKIFGVVLASVLASVSFSTLAASHGGAMKDDKKKMEECKKMDASKADDKMKAECKAMMEKK
jgi:Na+/H+-translocating membrane pyrophosphatase